MDRTQDCRFGDKQDYYDCDDIDIRTCLRPLVSQDCCETCRNVRVVPPRNARVTTTTTARSIRGTTIHNYRGRKPDAPPEEAVGSKNSVTEATPSSTPSWVAPVIATAGVVIVILVVVLIVGFVIRRRRRKQSGTIDERSGKAYKVTISDRAPVATPRPEVTFQKKTKLEQQDSAEYAYIYPDDVKPDPDILKRRDSNDPLPLRPGEYLDMGQYNKDDYLHPTDGQTAGGPAGDDYLRPRSDPYMYARLNRGDKRDNSYGQLPHREVSHENKEFSEEG